MNRLQILCAALAVALAVTSIPLGQQSYAHDGYWLEPIFTLDMPTEIAVGETVSMNYTVSWVDENGTPLYDGDKVGDNYDERPSKIILYLPDEIQITSDDVKLIKAFGTSSNSHMQGTYTRTIPYDTTSTITGTIEMKLLEPMFYEHDDIIFRIDSSRTTFKLQTVSTDNGIVIVDPSTDPRSDGFRFHLGIKDRYNMQFWHLEEETSQWSYNGRDYETNAKGFPDYMNTPEPKGQSSPSTESLKKQLGEEIKVENIQCDNSSHVLVQRPNGKLACVSERNAEKMEWEIIENNVTIPMEQKIITSDMNNEKQVLENIDYGTTTVTLIEDGTQSAISNFCADWPKNLTVQFPNAVAVGEEFDIAFHYTNIIFDEDDVLEAKQTGEAILLENAEDRLVSARDGCFDSVVYFTLNEKTSLITSNTDYGEPSLNGDTGRTKTYHSIEYPFNNTEEQIQIVTMRFDSLLDRYDSHMVVSTQAGGIPIYHFVDDNGIIFLNTPPSVKAKVAFSGVSALTAMTDEQKAQSDFYTKEIALPKKPVCEQFVCDENGVPVGNTEESLPPMESFAEFLKATVEPEDLVSWLENEEKLTSEYIKELLETYFPDLAAQFILFLNFDIIPVAHAAANDQVYLYGTATGADQIALYRDGTYTNEWVIPDETGDWAFNVMLVPGENVLGVTVVNEFDMTSPNDITVTLDIVE